jgi:hypothetical protein
MSRLDPTEEAELRMLYQITIGDLSYFKTQQWNVTYYALLVQAAFVGVAQILGGGFTLAERIALCVLALIAAISALIVIGKLERSIAVREARLAAVRSTFSAAFQKAWAAQTKPEPAIANVLLLRGGVLVTTLLTLWLLAYRLGAP